MHATKLYKKKKDQRRGMICRILEIKKLLNNEAQFVILCI